MAQTLDSLPKLKIKQVWSVKLNKQKFGTTISFLEGLENIPFKICG